MKFMLTYEVHPDQRHEVAKAFSQMTPEDDARDRGPNITLVGRWHDVARGTGVLICESDDAQAIAGWALNWNEHIDMDVTPVLDDAEARAVAKAKFSS